MTQTKLPPEKPRRFTPAIAQARICLATGPATSFYQRNADTRIEGRWRLGEIGVTLPDRAGECRTGSMRVIGLAIDLRHLPCEDCRIIADDLAHAARGLTRDPLIASVMMAVRHAAELHGASGSFFDHGLALVLGRLAQLNGRRSAVEAPRRPLTPGRLRRVTDMIDAHLATDISVGDLAREASMGRGSFTRAFQISTGYTPFAYLTKRRMEEAKVLLTAGLSVTEVAFRVGYSNPSKFSAAFRRLTDTSPVKWRSKLIG